MMIGSSIGAEVARFRHLGQNRKLPPPVVYWETQITAIPRIQGNLTQ